MSLLLEVARILQSSLIKPMEKKAKQTMHQKKSLRRNCSSGLPYPRGCYSPKQWMNHLMKITYTYKPSTTPLGDCVIVMTAEGDEWSELPNGDATATRARSGGGREHQHVHGLCQQLEVSYLNSLDSSKLIQKRNSVEPRGPQHTYYYIVVIIVARTKVRKREIK